MKYYQIHDGDGDEVIETRSLKVAYEEFNRLKKNHNKVRIDEYFGNYTRGYGFDGDYINDIELFEK